MQCAPYDGSPLSTTYPDPPMSSPPPGYTVPPHPGGNYDDDYSLLQQLLSSKVACLACPNVLSKCGQGTGFMADESCEVCQGWVFCCSIGLLFGIAGSCGVWWCRLAVSVLTHVLTRQWQETRVQQPRRREGRTCRATNHS